MKFLHVVAVFLLLALSPAFAALNATLADQGTNVRIKSTGVLLSAGSLGVEIYDAQSGGNLIYNETFANAIANGSWNVMLGENSSHPLQLEFGRQYFKDYRINGEDASFVVAGILSDRQPFYSPLGDINTSDIADSAVTGAKIENNAISDADISDSTNLTVGQKIAFALGGAIENAISAWIKITGNLNVTGNIEADNVTASYFFGNGSQLTGITFSDNSVTSAKIIDGNVNPSDINSSAVFTTAGLNVTGTAYINKINVTGEVFGGIVVPLVSTGAGGSNAPVLAEFATNGAGSQGVFTYMYSATIEQELYFTVQVPQDYREGSNLHPHVYWSPETAGSENVVWAIEYSWANPGSAFPNTTIIRNHTAATTARDLLITGLEPMNGTGMKISGIIAGRLFREAANTTDTYAGRAALMSVNFRYLRDGIGSRSPTEK